MVPRDFTAAAKLSDRSFGRIKPNSIIAHSATEIDPCGWEQHTRAKAGFGRRLQLGAAQPLPNPACLQLAGFYSGPVAKAIVAALRERGGVMSLEDLLGHRTTFVDPISTTYRGHRIYEVPPPTQARFNYLRTTECAPALCRSRDLG